jgi:hypothetical protein
MRKLLINKDDFTYWVDLSQNITEKVLNPSILDAQMRVLKGTMCASVYDEVYTQFLDDSLTTENQTLLDDYVIPLLVFSSYVNYLTTAGKRSTNIGIVKVIGDNTEQVTREELKDIISENKEKRDYYQNNLSNFLECNTDVYPLFLDCCNTQKAGFNFSSIGK